MKGKKINVSSSSSYYEFEIDLITGEIKQQGLSSPRKIRELNELELKLFESVADVVILTENNSYFTYEKKCDFSHISFGKPHRLLGYRLSNETKESLNKPAPYHHKKNKKVK